jgi:AraC-like DNA-binding protein
MLRGYGNQPESVAADGRMEIILQLADAMEELTPEGWRLQPRQLVSGQITRPIVFRPAGEVFTVGVRLRSWAGGALLREHASRLTDQVLDLNGVNAKLARALRPLLFRTSVAPDHIEAFLAQWLSGQNGFDSRIQAAVGHTERARGCGSVDELKEPTGISHRQLERLFQKHVGVGPKLFARIVRFRSVLKAIRGNPLPHWAGVAADHGYSDQPHLIRDFQQFAGCTPRALLESAGSLNLQIDAGS